MYVDRSAEVTQSGDRVRKVLYVDGDKIRVITRVLPNAGEGYRNLGPLCGVFTWSLFFFSFFLRGVLSSI